MSLYRDTRKRLDKIAKIARLRGYVTRDDVRTVCSLDRKHLSWYLDSWVKSGQLVETTGLTDKHDAWNRRYELGPAFATTTRASADDAEALALVLAALKLNDLSTVAIAKIARLSNADVIRLTREWAELGWIVFLCRGTYTLGPKLIRERAYGRGA